MANKNEYVAVRKYTQGNEVDSYVLRNLATGEGKPYTKIQVIFLVGRGQVKNMDAQLYKNKVLLRGIEQKLTDLDTMKKPMTEEEVQAEKKVMSEKILFITASIKKGRRSVGYLVKNTMTGEEKPLTRDKVIKLCVKKQIANAAVQRDNTNDSYIIRGEGCRLSTLPVLDADTLQVKRY